MLAANLITTNYPSAKTLFLTKSSQQKKKQYIFNPESSDSYSLV